MLPQKIYGLIKSWKRSHIQQTVLEKDLAFVKASLQMGSESIDATRKGSLVRFINHSCEPNSETRKRTVLGEIRVGIFPTQDIPAGTELAYDYNFESYGGAKEAFISEIAIFISEEQYFNGVVHDINQRNVVETDEVVLLLSVWLKSTRCNYIRRALNTDVEADIVTHWVCQRFMLDQLSEEASVHTSDVHLSESYVTVGGMPSEGQQHVKSDGIIDVCQFSIN
eukprot:Gb_20409 [translate_table: standard]